MKSTDKQSPMGIIKVTIFLVSPMGRILTIVSPMGRMLTMAFVTSIKKALNYFYVPVLTSISQLAYSVRRRICTGKVTVSNLGDSISVIH